MDEQAIRRIVREELARHEAERGHVSQEAAIRSMVFGPKPPEENPRVISPFFHKVGDDFHFASECPDNTKCATMRTRP